jgi:hypothetical protein
MSKSIFDRPTLALASLILFLILGVLGIFAFKFTRIAISGGTGFTKIQSYSSLHPPRYESIHSPHIILVLDVSQSMDKSDPDFMQSQAAERLFDIYSGLATEVLDKNDSAFISVIFFATIPQIVDWSGTHNLWLSATNENKDVFYGIIEKYLGNKKSDHRIGWNTDYLLAIRQVQQLVEGIKSPTLVVFMTDGKNEPHPFFSPLFSPAEKEAFSPFLYQSYSKQIAEISGGSRLYLTPKSNDGIFNVKDMGNGLDGLEVSEEMYDRLSLEIHTAIRELLSGYRSLDANDINSSQSWAPILLDVRKNDAIYSNAKSLLETIPDSIERGSGESAQLIRCINPNDLAYQFIGLLADWLHLKTAEPSVGNNGQFLIPSQTKAFAVCLQTSQQVPSVSLFGEKDILPLSGDGIIWAGVGRGDGVWKIKHDGSVNDYIKIYVKPRFAWLLTAPDWISPASPSDSIEVGMFLYSLDKHEMVGYSEFFPRGIPAQLAAEVEIGPRKFQVAMNRIESDSEIFKRSYAGYLQLGLAGTPEDIFKNVSISVDLRQMKGYDIPWSDTTLSCKIQMKSRLHISIKDATNKNKTDIIIRDIPKDGPVIKKLWGKIFDRF